MLSQQFAQFDQFTSQQQQQADTELGAAAEAHAGLGGHELTTE